MPVSPFQRGNAESKPEQPEGSSESRKSKSRPTSKRRAQRQKIKERYAKAREDAQLAGLISTTPEEALKPERVDPSTQSSQPLSELVAQAIKKGWAVEDGMKPHLIQEMVDIVMDVNMPAKAKITAFNALRMADQSQWDRDHPEVKPTAKGATGAIAISVQTNISATDLVQRMLADGTVRLDQISGRGSTNPPIIASSAGHSRHAGEVEAETAPPDDEPEVDGGVGNTEQSDSDSFPIPTR